MSPVVIPARSEGHSVHRKIIFTVLAAAAALSLMLLAAAFAHAYRAREFGDAFLADIRNLRVGQSTYRDVLRLQAKYRSRSSRAAGTCDENLCVMDFSGERLGLISVAVCGQARLA
jgi:hypothetical protein